MSNEVKYRLSWFSAGAGAALLSVAAWMAHAL